MKTAKQINDSQTGQIEPMVITKMDKDGKIEKVRPYTHPLTCQKCHRIINTQLCAVCEDEPQWLDMPNEEGWYWVLEKINDKWDLDTSKLFMADGELHDNEGYPVRLWTKVKWLKITEPTLPQEK